MKLRMRSASPEKGKDSAQEDLRSTKHTRVMQADGRRHPSADAKKKGAP